MLVPSPVGQPPSADWLLETVVVTGAGGRENFLGSRRRTVREANHKQVVGEMSRCFSEPETGLTQPHLGSSGLQVPSLIILCLNIVKENGGFCFTRVITLVVLMEKRRQA